MGQCMNSSSDSTQLSDNIAANDKVIESSDHKKVQHTKKWWDTLREHVTSGDIEYVKHLINSGDLSVNDVDYENYTLLVWASRKGQYDIVSLALNLGADIQYIQKDPNGDTDKDRTALQWAEYCGWVHVEQLLVFTIMNGTTGAEVQRYAASIDKQQGIINTFINNLDGTENAKIVKESIVNNMINTIKSKLVFSDDMLNLSWIFETDKTGDNNSNILQNNNLWNAIIETCTEIINARPSNEKDWYWLKHFMLPSTIWLIDIRDCDGEKKYEDETDEQQPIYLFNELLKVVKTASDALIQNDLVIPMNKIINNSQQSWKDLVAWDIDRKPMNATSHLIEEKNELKTPLLVHRQDAINNGVKSEFSKKEISQNIATSSFNALKHYDYKDYLSKLVFNAHCVDDEFQNDIQSAFGINKINKTNTEQGNKLIVYRRGPVKLTSRCIDKTETDYRDQPFPTSAHLLDINRCSLIFRDDDAMLKALNIFQEKIKNKQAGCIVDIIRAKNGFVEYAKSPQYADIKLNVVIQGKNGQNVVGEIQFLLDIMMNFKNDAHKLYAISRKEELFDAMKQTLPKLLDHTKQLYFAAGIANMDYIFDLMIIHNKTEEFVLQIMKDTSENIFHTICSLGNLKILQKIKSHFYLTEKGKDLFIKMLFHPNRYTEMSMEALIRRGHDQMLRYLFANNDIIQFIQSDEDIKWRMVLCVFSCDSDEFGPFILNTLKITNQEIKDKWTDFKSKLDTYKINIVWATTIPVNDVNKKRQWNAIGNIIGDQKREELYDQAQAIKNKK